MPDLLKTQQKIESVLFYLETNGQDHDFLITHLEEVRENIMEARLSLRYALSPDTDLAARAGEMTTNSEVL